MSIAPRIQWRALAVVPGIVCAVILSACSGTTAAPTVAALPKPSLVFDANQSSGAAPTEVRTNSNVASAGDFADGTFTQQAFPGTSITLSYDHDKTGNICVSYQLAASQSALHQRCIAPGVGTLIAVQGVENSSDGKVYTIVVGRVLAAQITAVSLEFSDGGNTPADVQSNGNFAVVLGGQRKAIHAVPVDQYGNLVGPIFAFGS